MLRDHDARLTQQLRSGQSLQGPRILFPQTIRRIEKHKICHHSRRFPLPQGFRHLALHDLEAARNPQRPQIFRDQLRRCLGRFNKIDRNSPAAQRLNPDRARPGIQIEPSRSRQRSEIPRAQHVEQRLSQPVRRRTNVHPAQGAQRPAPVLSRNHSHGRVARALLPAKSMQRKIRRSRSCPVTFDLPFRNFQPSSGV
jgi:hypothetical protein